MARSWSAISILYLLSGPACYGSPIQKIEEMPLKPRPNRALWHLAECPNGKPLLTQIILRETWGRQLAAYRGREPMKDRKRETFESVTLGHIRGHGVRNLLVYCNSIACNHQTKMKADHLPDFEPKQPQAPRIAPACFP